MRIVTHNGVVQLEGPDHDFVMKDRKPCFNEELRFKSNGKELIQLWETGAQAMEDWHLFPLQAALVERHEAWRVEPSPEYLESLEPDEVPEYYLRPGEYVLVPIEEK